MYRSPAMAFHRAVIIVPTYNERDNVRAVVERFLQPLPDSELLFVDDGSPDGTGQIIDEIVASNPRVHVLHRDGKRGLGTAYLAGFRWALDQHYDYVLEMDADFSHDPVYLPELVGACISGADMAVGSRYVTGGGTVNWGIGRRAISRGGGLYARKVLGVGVHDITSGFVCYRRRTLESVDLDAVRSNGYGFQIEMKYRVLRAGLRIVEVPIVFEDRRLGQSKMSAAIFAEAMWMVWRLRLSRLD
jgi:dolichol-phosphate mannosyltransferase